MARAVAGLPAGIRVSDHISLGVIARTFPLDQVRQILAETGRAELRHAEAFATSRSDPEGTKIPAGLLERLLLVACRSP